MLPFFSDTFANASSIDHLPGAHAKRAVDKSREAIANLVGARPEDVIFTSGATEANNLISTLGRSLITSTIEHPSILEPFRSRTLSGAHLTLVPVDSSGVLDHDELQISVRKAADAVVSIIATNNEVGTEQDLDRISDICYQAGVPLHLDATQMVATRQISIRDSSIAAVSLSAHKFYGPKGVGALVATSKLRRLLKATLLGGGQERGYRSGTLNVPGIVGFGEAAKLLSEHTMSTRSYMIKLREVFLKTLIDIGSDEFTLNAPIASSPHILSLRFKSANGRALIGLIGSEIAFSLGSACATNKSEPSHVLLAMGLRKSAIANSIRFSFSRYQSVEEVTAAARLIAEASSRLAELTLMR